MIGVVAELAFAPDSNDDRIGREILTAEEPLNRWQSTVVARVEQVLDIRFERKALLLQALTHSSFLADNPLYPFGHNERLEYLGDAVLRVIVRDYLFTVYPYEEGLLTKMEGRLCLGEELSEAAYDAGLHKHLLTAPSFQKGGRRKAWKCAGNALEAVIGALFIDQGLNGPTKDFVESWYIIPRVSTWNLEKDFISSGDLLNQQSMATYGAPPRYQIIQTVGPADDCRYEMAAYIDGREVGRGWGPTKKIARQRAAADALENFLIP